MLSSTITVRDFLDRVEKIVGEGDSTRVAAHHRRLLLPFATRFSLDGTLIRTLPVEPIRPLLVPGRTPDIVQLIEWPDAPDAADGRALDYNDLGVDLAAILALALGR